MDEYLNTAETDSTEDVTSEETVEEVDAETMDPDTSSELAEVEGDASVYETDGTSTTGEAVMIAGLGAVAGAVAAPFIIKGAKKLGGFIHGKATDFVNWYTANKMSDEEKLEHVKKLEKKETEDEAEK
jgi:hypothetical protein